MSAEKSLAPRIDRSVSPKFTVGAVGEVVALVGADGASDEEVAEAESPPLQAATTRRNPTPTARRALIHAPQVA